MSSPFANALRRHSTQLERSLSNSPDTLLRFVLALQTGLRPPERRTTYPSDGRWAWDNVFATLSRNTRRRIEPYSIFDHPLSAQPITATLWSAMYMTTGGDPVALDFIQQATKLAELAHNFLQLVCPTLRPWVFSPPGSGPLLGFAEVAWFSLVCRLIKTHEETSTVGLSTTFNTDAPTSEWTVRNHHAVSRFIQSWDTIDPISRLVHTPSCQVLTHGLPAWRRLTCCSISEIHTNDHANTEENKWLSAAAAKRRAEEPRGLTFP